MRVQWLVASACAMGACGVSMAQSVHEVSASDDAPSETAPQADPQRDTDEGVILREDGKQFRLELRAWAWLMGVDGDVGARGTKADVDADFIDILDDSDSLFALSGRIEMGYGRIGGFVDAFYADLGVDEVKGEAGDIDVDFEQAVVDFGLTYRFVDHEPDGDAGMNPRNLTLDGYVGGRYSVLDLELDPDGAPSDSRRKDWIDPIIGAKFVAPLAEHWHAELNADIGGFGVSSDFTWSATAVIGYDFHIFGAPSSVMFGYRAIGWDYSDGSGASEFTWDVIQHGLLLGFSISF